MTAAYSTEASPVLAIASDQTTFRQRMRIARVRKNLSQEELADRAGITVDTVSRIETGRHDPRIKTLRLLGRVLDVSLDWLVGQADEPD